MARNKQNKIKIIGTSHIAKESSQAIKSYILEEKPNIVAVELDTQRYHGLMSNERGKVTIKDIKHLGFMGFVFALIAQLIQRVLGKRVGMVPGADMRSAIVNAKLVKARIFLIDQDIHKTLYKISNQMSFFEKAKFFFYLIFGIFIPTTKKYKKLDLSKVPEDKIVEDMVLEFKNKFPKLYKVLITDRNKFMAKQIIYLREKFPDASILVVVGAGHKKGIAKIVKTTDF